MDLSSRQNGETSRETRISPAERLPPELVSYIIKELSRQSCIKAISACSQVSRIWRAQSIPFFFRNIGITFHTPATQGTSNRGGRTLESFLGFLDTSPHLSHLIHRLGLHGLPIPVPPLHEFGIDDSIDKLKTVLVKLPCLQNLFITIKYCDNLRDTNMTVAASSDPPLRPFRIDMLSFPHLDVSPVRIIPILALFDEITEFVFTISDSATASDHSDFTWPPLIMTDTFRPQSLTIRRLSFDTKMAFSCQEIFPCFEHILRPASLAILCIKDLPMCDIDPLNTFLACTGTKLRRLTCTISDSFQGQLSPIDLSPCSDLLDLSLLWLLNRRVHEQPERIKSWNLCLAAIRSAPSTLRSLHITLTLRGYRLSWEPKPIDALGPFDWSAFAAAIKEKSLETVELRIYFENSIKMLDGVELGDLLDYIRGIMGEDAMKLLKVNPTAKYWWPVSGS